MAFEPAARESCHATKYPFGLPPTDAAICEPAAPVTVNAAASSTTPAALTRRAMRSLSEPAWHTTNHWSEALATWGLEQPLLTMKGAASASAPVLSRRTADTRSALLTYSCQA